MAEQPVEEEAGEDLTHVRTITLYIARYSSCVGGGPGQREYIVYAVQTRSLAGFANSACLAICPVAIVQPRWRLPAVVRDCAGFPGLQFLVLLRSLLRSAAYDAVVRCVVHPGEQGVAIKARDRRAKSKVATPRAAKRIIVSLFVLKL